MGTISTKEAAARVGAAIYGDDWIGTLPIREKWLIERYIKGVRSSSPSSLLPSSVTYSIAGRIWAEYPSDPALVAEVERARDRRDWMDEQQDSARDWLESHGFDIDGEIIDAEALATALEDAFPSGPEMSSRNATSASAEGVLATGDGNNTKGINQRKRESVLQAIEHSGREHLSRMRQKGRELSIIDYCKREGLSVSDRYVREIWAEERS